VALPALSNDERDAARQKAVLARRARSAVRASLKAGTLTLAQVLERADNVVGRMPVRQLLTALPGVGRVRAASPVLASACEGAAHEHVPRGRRRI
jgi:hypothetical protein